MTQYLIVALAVIAAALYSAWIVMPGAWRRAAAARLAQQANRSGLNREAAHALQRRLESASACGDCASCKGCAVKPAAPATRQ